MKYIKKSITTTITLVGLLGLFNTTTASTWEDVLAAIKGSGNKFLDDGNFHDGSLYNSYIRYKVLNGNGNQNLDKNEKVYIEVYKGKNGPLVAKTEDTGYTEDELKDWANARADILLNTIFGADPSQTTTGQSLSLNTAQDVANQILTIGRNYASEMGKRIRGGLGKFGEKKDNKGKKKAEFFVKSFTTQVKLDSERGDIMNRGYDGDTSAGLFTFHKDLSNTFSFGSVLAYRTSKIHDSIGSKLKSLAITPFIKFDRLLKSDKADASIMLYGTVGAVYLKSRMFPDGAGYLDFAIGGNFMTSYYITRQFIWKFIGGYQIDKKYIPTSLVPDDLRFIADSINSLSPLHIVTVGTDFEYRLPTSFDWRVDAGVLHLHHLVTKDLGGRDQATYYTLRTKLVVKRVEFSLGYKLVRDVKDYSEKAYMASISYAW